MGNIDISHQKYFLAMLHVIAHNGLFTPPTRTRQNCLVWPASAPWTQLETRENCFCFVCSCVYTDNATRQDSFVSSVSAVWTSHNTCTYKWRDQSDVIR